MERLSLKELKAQNEGTEEVVPAVVVPEVEPVVAPKVEEVAEVVTDPISDPEIPATEDESWMEAEEPEASEGEKKEGFIPNHGVAAVKRKLKAKLEVKDSENAALKAEIEALKNGQLQQAPEQSIIPPRPKREDFDYDDDKYDAAIDDWNDKKTDLKLKSFSQSNAQKSQADKHQANLEKSIDSHYGKAAELVASGKITEDAYRTADNSVRQAIDEVFSGQGDRITDMLINTLSLTGDSSEKVMYQVGVSAEKREKLRSLMSNDPSGLAASAYLGTLQAAISSPKKRRNSGPKPLQEVNGEGGNGGPGGLMQKEYAKATDVQTRISLKRKARAQGVDVSQW